MTESNFSVDLATELKAIVGSQHTLTDDDKKQPYCQGFRLGSGKAYAVVRPASLVEIWKVLQACVKADVIVIMQAANTGLTGGSTPNGTEYDRPIVIISTMRIDDIHLIDQGKQIIGFAGSTLFGLEDTLKPYGREPHSVIGSSCIGASIVGGICNNSGGALVQRGPAYTELSLFAQVTDEGELQLVNNLGIELGSDPEEILSNLENKTYQETDVQFPDKRASDNEYHERIRDVDAETPSRFNADKRRLYESSGCAGKLAVFAVRIDTFPIPEKHRVFYIGTNDPAVMEQMRRDMLSTFTNLPVSGEYLHSSSYDISKKYGKDSYLVIDKLGTKYIPKMFAMKRTVDRWAGKFKFLPNKFSDRIMQYLSQLWPNHLPKRMEDFREQYEHHWIVETANDGVDEAQAYLSEFFKHNEGDYFECTEREADQAILHRFVTGGALTRYHVMNGKDLGSIMTIDVAFPRNEQDWFEVLPPEIDDKIAVKMYYGHFFCHVMHQNYIMKKGVDGKAVKQQILSSYDARGAEYPAEHNVGHEYIAKQSLRDFYKQNDPTNSFNPGIGGTSKLKYWQDASGEHSGCGCNHKD
ncbi:D-lactate dehydrogenase [Marinomonas posidonica]|uniref:Quinone-dependent D-lactate dehydrogenase n=1 Tax=Marinomonas posidonica (strain CECT 7376 / NCIMB 14433 / IVIA-Po-181) TaxID=491952 RepID=F6CWK2_MARPP|nr:D-lactate dehydrogenase [Marinomonas posidonica]AEF54352.1 D-lactate dehydrogenase [Marinomonas posidonica IVIA-Po-181]